MGGWVWGGGEGGGVRRPCRAWAWPGRHRRHWARLAAGPGLPLGGGRGASAPPGRRRLPRLRVAVRGGGEPTTMSSLPCHHCHVIIAILMIMIRVTRPIFKSHRALSRPCCHWQRRQVLAQLNGFLSLSLTSSLRFAAPLIPDPWLPSFFPMDYLYDHCDYGPTICLLESVHEIVQPGRSTYSSLSHWRITADRDLSFRRWGAWLWVACRGPSRCHGAQVILQNTCSTSTGFRHFP
jgi:hypothetical protein